MSLSCIDGSCRMNDMPDCTVYIIAFCTNPYEAQSYRFELCHI